jgi:hypothetical protein
MGGNNMCKYNPRKERREDEALGEIGETEFVREQYENIGKDKMSKSKTSLWYPHKHK